MRNRLSAAALLAVVVLGVLPAASGAAVRAPRSGATYAGPTAEGLKLSLAIAGKSIQIAGFEFKCRAGVVGRTGLQDIALHRSPRGYRFTIKAHGITTYSDDKPDENATISLSGRFSRTGRSAKGELRARTPRCGGSGAVSWRARKR